MAEKKCDMLIMKSREREIIERSNQTESERLPNRKIKKIGDTGSTFYETSEEKRKKST